MRWLGLTVLAACGRINFDPLGTADARGGDGTGADVASGTGTGQDCANARTLAVGTPLPGQSIATATANVATTCFSGAELVYAVTFSSGGARTFTIDADFDGSLHLAPSCPPRTSNNTCDGFTANQPHSTMAFVPAATSYAIVGKTAGTGTTFSISVQ